MPDTIKRLAVAIPIVAMLTIPEPRADAGQTDCATIISVVNSHVRSGAGKSLDMKAISKSVGVSRLWIEHCMQAYGRRLPRLAIEPLGHAKEDRLEEYEVDEPNDEAPEDLAEPEYEREQARRELRNSKERAAGRRKTPTPGGFKDF
jgi:hypothetical protein